MARKPARAPAPNGRRPNDDIGEEMRLKLYHSQFRLRQAEQRAYDLFLQNLVKGTSHLSLGPGGDRGGLRLRDEEGRPHASAPIAATPTRWRAACRSKRCSAS